MAFDFKKECKELYKPASKPSIVTVPPMSYVAVRGKGDPNTEGASIKTPCRCFTASPIPSRCRRKAQGVSRAISTLWYRRSRVSSGKTPRAATSIMYARTISTLSRAFACPISSPEMTLTGQSRKPRPKRNLTFLPSSCLKLTRASAFNACTPGPTTTNRRP